VPAPLLVVDAPYLLYRSFFGIPDTVRSPDGHPVNALLGSVNALLRVISDVNPRAVVICLGAEQAPYRVELFAGYHAARPPMPEDLAWQFERAPELFAALGWYVEGSDELEADDLLGSFAKAEADAGGMTLILTGDRDMYQCVTDRTGVLYLKQGSAGFEVVGAAEVRERYGIAPEQVPDFIALRGDPSDGLPGAPGIGEKTAADLLRRHGTLQRLLEAVSGGGSGAGPDQAGGAPSAGRDGGTRSAARDGGERPRIAAALRDNADLLRAFREIATLRLVDVARPPDRGTDHAGGAVAAAALGMGNLAGRLESSTA
jgi:DNA polymerase-1